MMSADVMSVDINTSCFQFFSSFKFEKWSFPGQLSKGKDMLSESSHKEKCGQVQPDTVRIAKISNPLSTLKSRMQPTLSEHVSLVQNIMIVCYQQTWSWKKTKILKCLKWKTNVRFKISEKFYPILIQRTSKSDKKRPSYDRKRKNLDLSWIFYSDSVGGRTVSN